MIYSCRVCFIVICCVSNQTLLGNRIINPVQRSLLLSHYLSLSFCLSYTYSHSSVSVVKTASFSKAEVKLCMIFHVKKLVPFLHMLIFISTHYSFVFVARSNYTYGTDAIIALHVFTTYQM